MESQQKLNNEFKSIFRFIILFLLINFSSTCKVEVEYINNCTVLSYYAANDRQCGISDMFPGTSYYVYADQSAEGVLIAYKKKTGNILKKIGPLMFQPQTWNEVKMDTRRFNKEENETGYYLTSFYFNGNIVNEIEGKRSYVFVKFYTINPVKWTQNCNPAEEPNSSSKYIQISKASLITLVFIGTAAIIIILIIMYTVFVTKRKNKMEIKILKNSMVENGTTSTNFRVPDDVDNDHRNIHNNTTLEVGGEYEDFDAPVPYDEGSPEGVPDYSGPHTLGDNAQYSEIPPPAPVAPYETIS